MSDKPNLKPNLTALQTLLAKIAVDRQAIADYMTEYEEIFSIYLAMTSEYNDSCNQAEHLARQVTSEEVGGSKTVNLNGAALKGKSDTTVHVELIPEVCGADFYVKYPTLVKSLKAEDIMALYPGIVTENPQLVDKVDLATLRSLNKSGALSKEVFERITTTHEPTYTISSIPRIIS
jgi:hypothetical protein